MNVWKVPCARAVLIILAAATLITIPVLVTQSVSSTPELVEWTHVASAAVVDDADIDKYAAGLSYIQFKYLWPRGGPTGSIYARANVACPSDNNDVIWNTLEVVYKDQDGKKPAYQVTVTLRRVKTLEPDLGQHSTVATFDSNVFADPVTSVQRDYVEFEHDWDFSHYAYFVELYLYRSNATYNPTIYTVRLCYRPYIP